MVKIKVLDANCVPVKGYPTDSGLDLKLRESAYIAPHASARLGSGVAMAIPLEHAGDIRPRSSATERGLLIQGTIDPDYRGEVMIQITNLNDTAIHVLAGERLAQCVVIKVDPEFDFVETLDDTERGARGFGHTGRF